MSFNVYRASYFFTANRNRYKLFVETEDDGKGVFIQVIGEIQAGMEYSIIKETKPEYFDGYLGKELIGTVLEDRYTDLLDASAWIQPPFKQLDEMGRKIYPDEPFYRDKEWLEDVIEELKNRGILRPV